MDLNLYPVSSLTVKELLFVGFDSDFDENIRDYPYESETYHYTIQNERAAVLNWLHERVNDLKTFRPPYAVLFALDWLERDGFELLNDIRANEDLRYIPIVALSKEKSVNALRLVQHGLDDCYTIPIDWLDLEKRLAFLNQYKSVLVDTAPKLEPEQVQIRVSPLKRAFDVMAASAGLIVLSPVMLLTALAIRLESKGPIIYRSKRVGAGYQTFGFLKFRSMYQDADRRLQELKHLNQYDGQDTVFVKFNNDPRITRVGRFIRKYSIDELPQLFNILRGDMSVVGNRPLPTYEATVLTKEGWSERFLAPAGLTGLWQVTKRGSNDMSVEERIALDVRYAQEYNFWTDMRILAKTFTAFVQKENV